MDEDVNEICETNKSASSRSFCANLTFIIAFISIADNVEGTSTQCGGDAVPGIPVPSSPLLFIVDVRVCVVYPVNVPCV